MAKPEHPTLFDIAVPPRPRQPRRWLMHVDDAGPDDHGDGACICVFLCRRCGYKSGWISVSTITEAKRGVPCPRCNATTPGGDPP